MRKRAMTKASTTAAVIERGGGTLRSREERLAAGKALRDRVPRESHAGWQPPSKLRDPVGILQESNRDRLPQLVPIRYGRMLRSPFTFLRGSAGLMAYDLSKTPTTGIRVQACGDCHLMNFGIFATPERNLVFDINDFDETLPAPWEWDVKRLATSFAVAARASKIPDRKARDIAIECARAYRDHLRKHSKASPLDIWYRRGDFDTIIAESPDAKTKQFRQRLAEKARTRIGEYLYPKVAAPINGRRRLIDQPPLLFHTAEREPEKLLQVVLNGYRSSLSDDRRVLFDGYQLEDIAIKVVGIGSVGTRCYVGLFLSADGHPLLLQFKEACRSVLERYAGKSVYQNHGRRVVEGQRLMQASSDIFLGWTRGKRGFDFFVRQLRDMKMSLPVEGFTPVQMQRYAEGCGLILARAHAKSGNSATISGYLGKSDVFDRAIGDFALAYADQTERDHAKLVAAEKAGRIEALIEEDM